MAAFSSGSSKISEGTALAIRGRDGPASLALPKTRPGTGGSEALSRILCVCLHRDVLFALRPNLRCFDARSIRDGVDSRN